MKKSIKKVSVIAATFLFTGVFSINYSIIQKPPKILCIPKRNQKSLQHIQFAPFFALGNTENLKSYHYGLKTLFNDYNIPTTIDHLYSIRSHSKYKGKVTHNQLLSHDLYHLIEEGSPDIAIFESELNNKCHFYLLHPKGLRHFTIERSNNLAMLQNGMGRDYPNLNYFIRCTTQIG